MKEPWVKEPFRKEGRLRLLRNEQGLTLVELLAVIVIIGILAAIAVPSISGLITKAKHQAHRANAQMIIDAARLKTVAEGFAGGAITVKELVDGGYLEKVPEDPENKGGTYKEENSFVLVTKEASTGNYKYSITLIGHRDGDSSETAYFSNVEETALKNTAIN